MILNHTYKFIFFKTTRVAGSSVESALSHLCAAGDIFTGMGDQGQGYHKNLNGSAYKIPLNQREAGWRLQQFLWSIRPFRNKILLKRLSYSKIDYWSHIPARHVKATISPEIWNTYHKISIERNPWDREVSRYFYKYSSNVDRRPAFSTFVRRAVPCYNYLIYSIDGRVVVDQLMRYKSLQEDFRSFLDYIGVKEEVLIPNTNASPRMDARAYRSLYDQELREIVAKRYRSEIEYCNYTF